MSTGAAAALLWRPDPLDVSIEIVGACNLRCPACGHGNAPPDARPMGAMELDLFDRILDKVERESAPGRPRIHLFNWGEPLLHPRAPEFVGRVKARGLSCRLSSNLVRPRDLRGVVEAGPDWLRVSVSGFTQGAYGQTHRGGDVERVKANMRTLRALIDEVGAPTAVEVNYHVYRHNAGDELARMRALARELRFSFEPIWSVAGSADKVIGWLERGIPESDRPHVERLVHTPARSREISERHRHLLPPGECALRDSVLVNSDGSVDLCCAVYAVPPVAASYLEATAEEIRERKRRAPICGPCMEHGLHLTYLYAGKAERDAEGEAVLAELAGARAAPAANQPAASHGSPAMTTPQQDLQWTQDPWRGSRPNRLLVAPELSNESWSAALPALVESLGAREDTTVGVALPLALCQEPPAPVVRAAEKARLDLLLIEAPSDDDGWKRLLGGASAAVLTSPADGLATRAAAAGLAVKRAPGVGAVPVAADANPLRERYLDLMKRCILNLIYEDDDILRKQAFAAELRQDGRDWPAVAHSMVGRKRLDNVQACVEDVLRAGVPGDLIETGVWRGGTTIFMRAILEAHGVRDRGVWVADSFEGLPPPDAAQYPADAGDTFHTYEELAIPLEKVQANFARYGLLDDQVRFLKGWFKDTLPGAPIDRLAVARLDGDMYESTMDALRALYPKLSVGGWLIVDDYGAVPGCKQAVDEYRQEHGLVEPIQVVDWTGVCWRRAR